MNSKIWINLIGVMALWAHAQYLMVRDIADENTDLALIIFPLSLYMVVSGVLVRRTYLDTRQLIAKEREAVMALAKQTFQSEHSALSWLCTPLPELNGRTPIEELDTSGGLARVSELLHRNPSNPSAHKA